MTGPRQERGLWFLAQSKKRGIIKSSPGVNDLRDFVDLGTKIMFLILIFLSHDTLSLHHVSCSFFLIKWSDSFVFVTVLESYMRISSANNYAFNMCQI